MKRRLFLAAAMLLAPLTAAGASTRVPVAFGDLDLSSEAGRAVLGRRINRAAARACASVHQFELAMRMACREDAVRDAHERLAARPGGAGTRLR